MLFRSAAPSIRRGGATNRLELTCAGTRITAMINGEPVASVPDSTYREGRWWIGVGFEGETPTEVRFDNLLLRQE